MLRIAVICAALAFAWACFAGDEAAEKKHELPPVFSKTPYAQALADSEKNKNYLLVKATAEWCRPCKMMDATTWRDEKIVAWVKESGTAIQIDVDEEEELSKTLRVSAMPTIIAFKDGKEFDRITGYRDADDFLPWLEGLKRGERAADRLAKQAAEESAAGVEARMELADALVNQGKHVEAADHYVWLWDNMLKFEPAMTGVRMSFMAGDMARLAEESEAAKAKFVALRDREEATLAGGKREESLRRDWLVLNQIVGDDQRTIAWYDTIKEDPKARTAALKNAWQLKEKLVAAGRWADYGRAYESPMMEYKRRVRFHNDMKDRMKEFHEGEELEEVLANQRESFYESIAQLHAGLLAAERFDNAKRVSDAALADFPGDEMKLALAAVADEAGVATQEHLDWLQAMPDAMAEHGDLIRSIQKKLADKKPAE